MKTKFHIEFKIKLGKGDKRYFKVFIFKDRKTMYKFYQGQLEITGQEGRDDFEAMYQPFTKIMIDGKTEYTKNHIGNLLLYSTKMGSGLISHEMGHAAFDYWRRLNPREGGEQSSSIHDMGQEEEFLFILGYLVAQFWTAYFKYEKAIKRLVAPSK